MLVVLCVSIFLTQNFFIEGEIRGFWFFEEEDCTRLYKLLVKLASGSSPSTSANINNPKRAVSVNSQNGYSAHSNTAAGRGEAN